MATGLSKTEAKRDICHAMADGKIRIIFAPLRAEIIETKQVLAFVGTSVNIPRNLRAGDLDWRKSCPTTPWQHRDHPWVQVHLARVELSSADVTLTLCGGRKTVEVPTEVNLQARQRESRGKSRPARGQAQAEVGEPTFDPKEWITIDAAAEILRFERDSSDSGRLRLMELLRREPSIAHIVAATLPPLVNADVEPAGLIPLPHRSVWVGTDDVDWAASTVPAFPLLSGTDGEDRCSREHMLGVRVNRAAVEDAADQQRAAEVRSREVKREMTARLFAEPFWPASRALGWIAFRDPQLIEKSWTAAKLYESSELGRALRDRNPSTSLLRALQDGGLSALKDCNELPREKWATATGRIWPDDVRFRREDVLALWPEESERRGLAAQGATRTSSHSRLPSSDIRARGKEWREKRIERFTERQRESREWINFAEIADWCSREDGSIAPNEPKRAKALQTLANDLLTGEFEQNGRSRVLYLHPWTTKARMTREHLSDAIDNNYDCDQGKSEYLPYCWIPRKMFVRWLAKHRLPQSPERFQRQKSDRVSMTTSGSESAAVKALASELMANPGLSRAMASDWCETQGYKLTGRGFQSRVWPEARKRAGLDPRASPGRKSKSSR